MGKIVSCKHFKGIMRARKESCGAGLDVREVTGGSNLGWLNRIPCMNPCSDTAACEKFEELSQEEVEAKEAKNQEFIDRTVKMFPLMAQMKKDHPEGGQGTVECPSCRGVVHYTVASSNLHTSGSCETKDCMSWIE
jgi:hypothetical protein